MGREMEEVALDNCGCAGMDKTYEIGSKLVRTRVCKPSKPLLTGVAAQHNVAYLVRAWLVSPQGEDIMDNGCKAGFTERTDTVHQSQVVHGVLQLMTQNEGMTESEAKSAWWSARHDSQRQKAAEECYSKCFLAADVINDLGFDPEEE